MTDANVVLPKMPFLSLNLGHVLTIISMLGGGLMAYDGMKSEMQLVHQRVGQVEVTLAQLATIVTLATESKVEIAEIKRRLDRLEQKPRL